MEDNEQENNDEDRLSVAEWAGAGALVGGLGAGAIEVAAVSFFSVAAILPGFSVGLAAWYAIPTVLQGAAIGGGLGGAGAAIYNSFSNDDEESAARLIGDDNSGMDGE